MQEQSLGKLNIIVAVYGVKTVTDQVTGLVIDGKPQTLNFTVNNLEIGEDGWTGQRKTIMIVYNYDGGDLQVATAKEGDVININPDKLKIPKPVVAATPADNGSLSVLAATYGPDDVTYRIKKMISEYNTLSFTVENTVFGDPWYGVAKTLVIVLGSGNEVRSVEIFTERETCYIDLNDIIPAL